VPVPNYGEFLKADAEKDAEIARLRTMVDILRGDVAQRDEKIAELTQDINELHLK
jgi:hypothetical protein